MVSSGSSRCIILVQIFYGNISRYVWRITEQKIHNLGGGPIDSDNLDADVDVEDTSAPLLQRFSSDIIRLEESNPLWVV